LPFSQREQAPADATLTFQKYLKNHIPQNTKTETAFQNFETPFLRAKTPPLQPKVSPPFPKMLILIRQHR
jgi:hypothetical protein